jgi:hypothetical protein
LPEEFNRKRQGKVNRQQQLVRPAFASISSVSAAFLLFASPVGDLIGRKKEEADGRTMDEVVKKRRADGCGREKTGERA